MLWGNLVMHVFSLVLRVYVTQGVSITLYTSNAHMYVCNCVVCLFRVTKHYVRQHGRDISGYDTDTMTMCHVPRPPSQAVPDG